MPELNYRSILQEVYQKRKGTNPRYTIRAYAKFLDLDSGTLSAILKGKRKLPKTHWISCSKKLKLSKAEQQHFIQSLWHEHGLQEKTLPSLTNDSHLLDPEHYYEIISEWEFATALCLLDIRDYELTAQSISRDLGLTLKRANEVYGKLFQYKLLEFKENKVVKSNRSFETTDDVAAKALEKAHSDELLIAQRKLTELSVLEREFSSLTVACRARDMKKMKIWIRQKKIEFEKLFEKPNADQVFLFSMQLLPLSKKVER